MPDRHPIPRVQETLDSLGGNAWFSVLDLDSSRICETILPTVNSICDTLGVIRMGKNPIRSYERPSKFSEVHGTVFRRIM